MHSQEALKQLEQLGLKRTKDAGNRVFLQEGNPAPAPEQKFHVQSQTPAAGTPLQPGVKVTLRLFADPTRKTAQK
jgi:beta-lactam-binding protein with PASTA domain